MSAVYRHELRSYFTGLTAYIFGAFVLLFAGIYTVVYNVRRALANFEFAIASFAFVFLIAVPILTMRVIAEERRQRTDQLLYSLPITMTDVVLGKYFALLTVFALPVAIICTYPLILGGFGHVRLSIVYVSILAYFVMGAALIAIGVFLSSLSESTALSAGLCFVVLLINYMLKSLSGFLPSSSYASYICFLVCGLLLAFILYLMTKNIPISLIALAVIEAGLFLFYRSGRFRFYNLFPKFLTKLSLFEAFYLFPNGVFSVSALVFLLSVIVFFLFLTEQSLEKRRWN